MKGILMIGCKTVVLLTLTACGLFAPTGATPVSSIQEGSRAVGDAAVQADADGDGTLTGMERLMFLLLAGGGAVGAFAADKKRAKKTGDLYEKNSSTAEKVAVLESQVADLRSK